MIYMLSETKTLIQDYTQEFYTALLHQGLVIKFNIHIIPCLLFPTSKNNILFFCFVGDFNCHHSEWLGWDHASLMPMVWLLLISPLLLTVRNWLMDPPIGLKVCWILLWQMFRIYVMCMFMAMLMGRTMRRLESLWIYHRLLLDLMYLAGFSWSQELIGMPFVRLCLDLTGEVFSRVRPWFTILIEKSVELWSDSFQWLL